MNHTADGLQQDVPSMREFHDSMVRFLARSTGAYNTEFCMRAANSAHSTTTVQKSLVRPMAR